MGHSPKLPERAFLCQWYDECLDLAARFDLSMIPCANCTLRRELMSWVLPDYFDILACYYLLGAIFSPELYHRYLIWIRHCTAG